MKNYFSDGKRYLSPCPVIYSHVILITLFTSMMKRYQLDLIVLQREAICIISIPDQPLMISQLEAMSHWIEKPARNTKNIDWCGN